MSEKLAMLALTQEKVRVAERRVDAIRDMEEALANGRVLILKSSFVFAFSGTTYVHNLQLDDEQKSVLAEGLMIARLNAQDDVDRRVLAVEEMLK